MSFFFVKKSGVSFSEQWRGDGGFTIQPIHKHIQYIAPALHLGDILYYIALQLHML